MAKLEIPIHVYMGELEEIINELKHLQTYKLFEGSDKVLVDCDDAVKIFANHLHAEITQGLVRCKDCIHYGDDCILLFPADGYCYDGKRRVEKEE